MEPLGSCIRQRPRTAAALAFGSVTTPVTHLAWAPDARTNGVVPALTIAAGVAHALAGAITGRRLVDGTRTRTSPQAGFPFIERRYRASSLVPVLNMSGNPCGH